MSIDPPPGKSPEPFALEISSNGEIIRPNLGDAEVRSIHFSLDRVALDIVTMDRRGPAEILQIRLGGVGRVFCQTDHLQNIVDRAMVFSDASAFENFLTSNQHVLVGQKDAFVADLKSGLKVLTFSPIAGFDFSASFKSISCVSIGVAPPPPPDIEIGVGDRL